MYQKFLILLLSVQLIESSITSVDIIMDGGYTAKLCLDKHNNDSKTKRKNQLNCSSFDVKCENSYYYHCKIPCGYNPGNREHVNGKAYIINWKDKPIFNLLNIGSNYESGYNLTIDTKSKSLSLLDQDQIYFIFTHNISCSNKFIIGKSIICKLNLSLIETGQMQKVNVSIQYGLKCNKIQLLGDISVVNFSLLKRHYRYIFGGIIIIIILIIIIVLTLSLTCVLKKIKREKILNKKNLDIQEKKFFTIQQKCFREYLNAVKSFNNLGKLTPFHFQPFYEYLSQIFKFEVKTKEAELNCKDIVKFQFTLLNQSLLINWIDTIETDYRTPEKGLISSLLTIVLFQHPKYFLDLMKVLMKKNSSEAVLFKRTDSICENLVINWFRICMYESLKTSEVGKRFFNLFRALKCKMDTGVVDMYTKKAKFVLSLDHIMLSEQEYDVLKIKVSVDLSLPLVNNSNDSLKISLSNIEVEVLSLDCITQVKEKIIEKAIMIKAEEHFISSNESLNLAFADIDTKAYNLHFVSKTTQIALSDFDRTSVPFPMDSDYTIANTMKHYNMKSGMNFLLKSLKFDENYFDPNCYKVEKTVHLQMPMDLKDFNSIKKTSRRNSSSCKSPVIPSIQDKDTESYLIQLLTIKKSLDPFIEGFIQSVTNVKHEECGTNVTNKEPQVSIDLLNNTCSFNFQDSYSKLTCYLFSILDEIWESSSINNETTLMTWKRNIYIIQFWNNLIKNPSFIFTMGKNELVESSLITVADILIESSFDGKNNYKDSQIVQQMFLDDIRDKYSGWWQTFANTKYSADESDIVSFMMEIVEKNQMKNHYNSTLKSLENFTKTKSKKEQK